MFSSTNLVRPPGAQFGAVLAVFCLMVAGVVFSSSAAADTHELCTTAAQRLRDSAAFDCGANSDRDHTCHCPTSECIISGPTGNQTIRCAPRPVQRDVPLNCPPNAHAVNGRCQCFDGFEQYAATDGPSGSFVCLSACLPHSVRDGLRCVCEAGTHINSQTNTCVSCPAGQAWDGSQCQCPAELQLTHTGCRACTAQEQYNRTTMRCEAMVITSDSVPPPQPPPSSIGPLRIAGAVSFVVGGVLLWTSFFAAMGNDIHFSAVGGVGTSVFSWPPVWHGCDRYYCSPAEREAILAWDGHATRLGIAGVTGVAIGLGLTVAGMATAPAENSRVTFTGNGLRVRF